MTKWRRILVPIDFSQCARRAVETAASFAQLVGATVDALHVWQPPTSVTPGALVQVPGLSPQPIEEFVASAARREMDVFLTVEAPEKCPVKALIERGDPAATILRVAEEGRYDLIVMGTRGRTGMTHVMMGSVAEKVARHAPCAVLLVKRMAE